MQNIEKQTLIELWNGNIAPSSDGLKTPQQTELLAYLDRHSKSISKKLDKEGLESFEKFKDCYDELYKIACEDAFVKGFSLASKMLSEALS